MQTLFLALMLACIPGQAIAEATTANPADAFSIPVTCPRLQVCPALIDTLDALTPLGLKYFNVPGAAIAL
jgi:hypothetical protein